MVETAAHRSLPIAVKTAVAAAGDAVAGGVRFTGDAGAAAATDAQAVVSAVFGADGDLTGRERLAWVDAFSVPVPAIGGDRRPPESQLLAAMIDHDRAHATSYASVYVQALLEVAFEA